MQSLKQLDVSGIRCQLMTMFIDQPCGIASICKDRDFQVQYCAGQVGLTMLEFIY